MDIRRLKDRTVSGCPRGIALHSGKLCPIRAGAFAVSAGANWPVQLEDISLQFSNPLRAVPELVGSPKTLASEIRLASDTRRASTERWPV